MATICSILQNQYLFLRSAIISISSPVIDGVLTLMALVQPWVHSYALVVSLTGVWPVAPGGCAVGVPVMPVCGCAVGVSWETPSGWLVDDTAGKLNGVVSVLTVGWPVHATQQLCHYLLSQVPSFLVIFTGLTIGNWELKCDCKWLYVNLSETICF